MHYITVAKFYSCTKSYMVRFPTVSLEFFIDVIFPVAIWPWGLTQPLTEKSTRNISLKVKAVDCLEIW